jgi:hypothetical protein
MKKTSKISILVIVITLFLGAIFHFNYIDEFPSHIHSWAQSDRIALALGFIDNGFNFFKPQTYILNHQFPGDWQIQSQTGITSVDFPLNEFLVAAVMKLTGSSSPIWFRLFMLIYSLVGLVFLFKLSYHLTQNYLKSIFPVILLATSPLFIYYQNGFLPSISALSNAIIGIYFYLRYIGSNKNHYIWLTMVFLTLSALSRTTFLIPLVAVCGVEFLRIIQKKSLIYDKIVPFLLSAIFLTGHYFYNLFLTSKYGSIYLNHFMMAENTTEFFSILSLSISKWGDSYFSKPQWFIILIVLGFSILSIIKNYKKKNLIKDINSLALLFLLLVGNGLFLIVMIKQFENHDYYFLDTFMLPSILIFIILLRNIHFNNTKPASIFFTVFIVSSSLIFVFQGIEAQKSRRISNYLNFSEATVKNFQGSSEFLDSLQIATNEKILVLNASAPNIPFIFMNRKGFILNKITENHFKNTLDWDYEFVVFQNDFFISDIIQAYPEIIYHLEKIADNGKITLCKKKSIPHQQNIAEFLQLDTLEPTFSHFNRFDSKEYNKWSNIFPDSLNYYSPPTSSFISSENPYGPTIKLTNLAYDTTIPSLLQISFFTKITHLKDFDLVVSIESKGNKIYYKSLNIKPFIIDETEWHEVELYYQMPAFNQIGTEINIYFYNYGKAVFYIDDFLIKIL